MDHLDLIDSPNDKKRLSDVLEEGTISASSTPRNTFLESEHTSVEIEDENQSLSRRSPPEVPAPDYVDHPFIAGLDSVPQSQATARHSMLLNAFDAVDVDKSGTLSYNEVSNIFQTNEDIGIAFDGDVDIRTLFAAIDMDGDGEITRDEFLEVCGTTLRQGGQSPSIIVSDDPDTAAATVQSGVVDPTGAIPVPDVENPHGNWIGTLLDRITQASRITSADTSDAGSMYRVDTNLGRSGQRRPSQLEDDDFSVSLMPTRPFEIRFVRSCKTLSTMLEKAECVLPSGAIQSQKSSDLSQLPFRRNAGSVLMRTV
eukprot:m.51324 g.51324  ORF g.51324 m.51324 type:complete len:313 (+) comp15377_c1_seq31:477-1415(+)